MKSLIISLFFLIGFNTLQVHGQKRRYWDAVSNLQYKGIIKANKGMGTNTIVTAATALGIANVINSQADELRTTAWQLRYLKKKEIKYFISFRSYGYVKKKYPIGIPYSPGDIFRNTKIRFRFNKKLKAEAKNVDNYLNQRNPIPEGERILLVLTALENVINITLEHEEY